MPGELVERLVPNGQSVLDNLQPRNTITDDLLAELALTLCRHSENTKENNRIYRESLEHTLLAHILFRYGGLRAGSVPIGRRSYRLSERHSRLIVEYMRAHLQRNVGLEELARHLGLSVSHFSTQFKNRFGETPARYLWSMRLDCAREQLENKALPVSEIAAHCGCLNPSHFSEAFRRAYGATPTEYRNSR